MIKKIKEYSSEIAGFLVVYVLLFRMTQIEIPESPLLLRVVLPAFFLVTLIVVALILDRK